MLLTTFLLGYYLFPHLLLTLFLSFCLPLLGADSPPVFVSVLVLLLQSELLKFLHYHVESLYVPVSLSIGRNSLWILEFNVNVSPCSINLDHTYLICL